MPESDEKSKSQIQVLITNCGLCNSVTTSTLKKYLKYVEISHKVVWIIFELF